MVHVAAEMDRRNMNIPLLIGGATTSAIHTAVKIDPNYTHPVVYVKDASKVIGVASQLLSEIDKVSFVNQTKTEYQNLRQQHLSSKKDKMYISLEEARKNKFQPDWDLVQVVKPAISGNRIFTEYPLDQIRPYIDWTFFFHAWKLNGKYPAIFEDPVKGEEAKKLFDDANLMLDIMIAEKWLKANAVIGFYPAASENDSVIVFHPEKGNQKISAFHFLRNQEQKAPGIPNLCLADFIIPEENQRPDYFGGFVVTAGKGIEEHIARFEKQNDDYAVIMLKILADRLAEAFAELMHKLVRTVYWGYAADENLTMEEMLKEQYSGIRPAPGYPACPEHSEKRTLFDLLQVEKNIGVSLTENYAMYPAASVSGFYFVHPDSQYFNVGKILPDQISDYAGRKEMSNEQVEKLLAVNIVDND
jgi:5-methyltetrahydrofolate--homocysteine methyltransferase